MGKASRLWRLAKALNDEDPKKSKITLEEDEKLLTGKKAANLFAQGYSLESNNFIPRKREKEVRQEQKRRRSGKGIHQAMQENITMAELRKALGQLKKRKSPGPDSITNEMLQYLGNTALQKLLDIFNLS